MTSMSNHRRSENGKSNQSKRVLAVLETLNLIS